MIREIRETIVTVRCIHETTIVHEERKTYVCESEHTRQG